MVCCFVSRRERRGAEFAGFSFFSAPLRPLREIFLIHYSPTLPNILLHA